MTKGINPHSVRDICTLTVVCSVSRPFCCFTRVYKGHFMLCYKYTCYTCCVIKRGIFSGADPLDCAKANFRGHRSAWFLLLSACRFAEFNTSVICHVFMNCLGSFLKQDMSPRICFRGTKYKNGDGSPEDPLLHAQNFLRTLRPLLRSQRAPNCHRKDVLRHYRLMDLRGRRRSTPNRRRKK